MGIESGGAIRIRKHPAQPRPTRKRYLTAFPPPFPPGMLLQARKPRPARKTMRQRGQPPQAAWERGQAGQTARKGGDFGIGQHVAFGCPPKLPPFGENDLSRNSRFNEGPNSAAMSPLPSHTAEMLRPRESGVLSMTVREKRCAQRDMAVRRDNR
jgi:hypothetical protein